jgi:hypothetical protein
VQKNARFSTPVPMQHADMKSGAQVMYGMQMLAFAFGIHM